MGGAADVEQGLDEAGEDGKLVEGLTDLLLRIGAALLRQKERVDQALQGVVDKVSQFVGAGGAGGLHFAVAEEKLLLLVAESHGSKGAESGEEAVILHIEGFAGVVGHGPDGAAQVIAGPRDEETVGDLVGGDAEEVVVRLGDTVNLGALGIEAGAAGAKEAGGGGVEVLGKAAGDGHPAEAPFAVGGFFFEADAGAVGATEADGELDQLVEEPIGMFDEKT